MCASYDLIRKGEKKVEFAVFDQKGVDKGVAEWMADPPPVVRPTGPKALNFAPIVTRDGVELAWWGLWVGASPGKFSTINARVEKLTSGLWRKPLLGDRVLVPAAGYFEYRDEGGAKKQRYRFRLPGDEPFTFAGLAAPVYGEGLPKRSYAIVTREPTDSAAEIHNRMPLLIPESFRDVWIDPANDGDETIVDAALAVSEEIGQRLSYEPA